MNTNDDLPGRARDIRKNKLKLTQEEVAAQAGISKRTYQNFESRVTRPQGDNLRAILRVLGMDAEQENIAEATREEWRPSTRVITDMLGAYLETLSEEEAVKIAHELTRQIWQGRLGA